MVEKIPSRRKGFSADIRMYPMFVPSLVLCPLIFVRSVFAAFFITGKLMLQPVQILLLARTRRASCRRMLRILALFFGEI